MSEVRVIPGYTLLRPLGRGNTSLVYLAADETGRHVALKLPRPQTLTVQEAAERFGNEVRLTLKFRHPHVVHGYAGTPFGPQAFLALQYYPQGDLSEQLDTLPDRRLPVPAALRILADVASALTHLHRLGAVHQDVKPHNVYVHEGRAALGDLGSTYFTAQGSKVSGSPYYMSPEIYHGESSSGASDVYSLGILAYELLTGQRPYTGRTYEELMVAHLTRFPPPLLHLNSQVDRRVARLAEQALAKRPAERPSADDLRRALVEALGETPQDDPGESTASSPEDPARARVMGRHSTTPAPDAEPAVTADPEKGRSWNPFRRRKS